MRISTVPINHTISECETKKLCYTKRTITLKMDGKRVKPIEHPSIFVQPGTIPAFLLKLRNLLDDPDCDHLISWDPVSAVTVS